MDTPIPMMIDSHCHLDFPELNQQLPELLEEMKKNSVVAALCIGVNLEKAQQVISLAEQHDNLLATVGVHPEYKDAEEPDVERLCSLAQHERVVAIGETGLDYHWHKDQPVWQQQRFRTHIQAARKLAKPLVIHTREASVDTIQIMKDEQARDASGVMHCFTESWDVAKQALDLGFYISFSGIVTFKNATTIQEVAQKTPLDRLLIETDSPFLAPVPYRGKTNQPAYVRFVAEKIAELRNITTQEVAQASMQNFLNCFTLAKAKLNINISTTH